MSEVVALQLLDLNREIKKLRTSVPALDVRTQLAGQMMAAIIGKTPYLTEWVDAEGKIHEGIPDGHFEAVARGTLDYADALLAALSEGGGK